MPVAKLRHTRIPACSGQLAGSISIASATGQAPCRSVDAVFATTFSTMAPVSINRSRLKVASSWGAAQMHGSRHGGSTGSTQNYSDVGAPAASVGQRRIQRRAPARWILGNAPLKHSTGETRIEWLGLQSQWRQSRRSYASAVFDIVCVINSLHWDVN